MRPSFSFSFLFSLLSLSLFRFSLFDPLSRSFLFSRLFLRFSLFWFFASFFFSRAFLRWRADERNETQEGRGAACHPRKSRLGNPCHFFSLCLRFLRLSFLFLSPKEKGAEEATGLALPACPFFLFLSSFFSFSQRETRRKDKRRKEKPKKIVFRKGALEFLSLQRIAFCIFLMPCILSKDL